MPTQRIMVATDGSEGVLRTPVGQHPVLGAAEELVDRPVDRLANDVPEHDIDHRGIVVRLPNASQAHAVWG